ncbi:MAG: methionine--tRNA ligase [Bdellovibrionales bacterium]|nr:methionine--tRNA ligase [Bdellovibrionales bacterium]
MKAAFSEKIYITTPLYYVNAKPHLGHAYSTILADAMARFSRQKGLETCFLTGTDEHGEKIATMAKKEGKAPLEFTSGVAKIFQDTWSQIGLKPDVFYRTTFPSHYALVQRVLQTLKDKGEIYFESYEGKYCVGCERFRTDQEWNEQGVCPDHLTPPEIRKESNYFFKMGAYRDRLRAHYQAHPHSLQPEFYLKEVLSFLDQPLEDLCISRPTSRLEWGIPLPFDDKYVTYVWFDALLSYLGGIGYGTDKFRADFWANSNQLIGKDILKTHAIYWPTMLMAMGLEPFQRLQVSGFILMSGIKMSKSLGNVVDPLVVQERFGIETLRYYLLRDVSYGTDSTFAWEGFINRCNAELANGIGNLTARTLTLTQKNLDAKMPSRAVRTASDNEFLASVHKLPDTFAQEFASCRYHVGLAAFAETVASCDRYINDNKPWALAKDPAQKERLAAVLGTAMDALWTLSVVMNSVLPEGSLKLRRALGDTDAPELAAWSTAKHQVPEGRALGEVPRLYPRLELPVEDKA